MRSPCKNNTCIISGTILLRPRLQYSHVGNCRLCWQIDKKLAGTPIWRGVMGVAVCPANTTPSDHLSRLGFLRGQVVWLMSLENHTVVWASEQVFFFGIVTSTRDTTQVAFVRSCSQDRALTDKIANCCSTEPKSANRSSKSNLCGEMVRQMET